MLERLIEFSCLQMLQHWLYSGLKMAGEFCQKGDANLFQTFFTAQKSKTSSRTSQLALRIRLVGPHSRLATIAVCQATWAARTWLLGCKLAAAASTVQPYGFFLGQLALALAAVKLKPIKFSAQWRLAWAASFTLELHLKAEAKLPRSRLRQLVLATLPASISI